MNSLHNVQKYAHMGLVIFVCMNVKLKNHWMNLYEILWGL